MAEIAASYAPVGRVFGVKSTRMSIMHYSIHGSRGAIINGKFFCAFKRNFREVVEPRQCSEHRLYD